MKDSLFAAFLRSPRFRGRDRLMVWLRERLYRSKPGYGLHGLCLYLDPMKWAQVELMQDRHPAEPA